MRVITRLLDVLGGEAKKHKRLARPVLDHQGLGRYGHPYPQPSSSGGQRERGQGRDDLRVRQRDQDVETRPGEQHIRLPGHSRKDQDGGQVGRGRYQ